MTANQLKYWELRWKQFYDMRNLEVDIAKLQHEKDKLLLEAKKLNETIRHNMEEERNDRITRRQNAQKIQQEWAKISQNERLALIGYGIKWKELEQEDRKLDQADRKLDQTDKQIALEADKILKDKFTAVGDFLLEVEKNKNSTSQEWVEQYSEAIGELGKAFGLGAVGLAAGETRGMVASAQYDKIVNAMKNNFPEVAKFFNTTSETYGPDIKEAIDQLRKGSDELGGTKGILKKQGYNVDQLPGQGAGRVIGFSETETEPDSTTSGTSVEKVGKTGSKYYDNHHDAGSTRSSIESKTSNGTSVVYSPGTHYGPGF